jgi:PAS domain S-box-containing protein
VIKTHKKDYNYRKVYLLTMIQQDNLYFEECFEAAHQFMGILDGAGRIIRVNRAGIEFLGLTQADLTGTPLWLIPWPALKEQNRQALKRVISQAAAGTRIRDKLKTRLPGETEKIIELSIQPIQDEAGRLKFLFIEGQDITAYRHTLEALFQSEARFRTIFEEAGIGIVIKAANGKMLDCNPAFEEMIGYTADELRQYGYLEITHVFDKKVSRKLFRQMVTGKQEHYFVEKRYLHKNGSTVWVRMTASPVRGQDGAVKYIVAVVENITAHKQIEAELSELQRRLRQGRDMERLRLAQDLHDGPLQEIIGVSYSVQELINSIQDEASREQLQAIRASLQNLARSVRTTCGELRPPTLVPFGLEKTIRSHLEEFQAAHPGLSVSHKLARDGQTLSESTRIVLFRIYQEALNNILRHASAQTVEIRFKLTTKKAVLEIQDDGSGFELPNHWVKLARQGHLGLVGAMERASEVDGHLEVTTAPGQGTLIRVSIPIKEEGTALPVVGEESKK